MDTLRENIFIPTSGRSSALTRILPQLTNVYVHIRISTCTCSVTRNGRRTQNIWPASMNWIRISIHRSTNNLFPEAVRFTQSYRRWYSKHGEHFPKYGMLGFDTGYFFLKGLSQQGNKFEENHGQSIHLKHPHSNRIQIWESQQLGGFINRKVFFFSFDQELRIDQTWFWIKWKDTDNWFLYTACFCCCPCRCFAQLQDERHNLSVKSMEINLNSVSFTPASTDNFIAPEFGRSQSVISLRNTSKWFVVYREKSTFPSEDGRKSLKDGSNNTYHRAMNLHRNPFISPSGTGKTKETVPGSSSTWVQVGFLLGKNLQRPSTWIPPTVRKELMNNTESCRPKIWLRNRRRKAVEIRTGIGHFLLEARYYFGLSDFYNNSKKIISRSAQSYHWRTSDLFILIWKNNLYD